MIEYCLVIKKDICTCSHSEKTRLCNPNKNGVPIKRFPDIPHFTYLLAFTDLSV